MMTLGIVLFAVAVVLGLCQGRLETTAATRTITGVALLAVSNLLCSWPYFVKDPDTWLTTYATEFMWTGAVSLIVHVVPFLVAWRVGKWLKSTSKSNTAT